MNEYLVGKEQETADDAQVQSAEARILAALSTFGRPMTLTDLAEKTDVHMMTLWPTLQELIKTGLIIVTGSPGKEIVDLVRIR